MERVHLRCLTFLVLLSFFYFPVFWSFLFSRHNQSESLWGRTNTSGEFLVLCELLCSIAYKRKRKLDQPWAFCVSSRPWQLKIAAYSLWGQVMKLSGGNGAYQLVGPFVDRCASHSLAFCTGMSMIFLDPASCNYLHDRKQRHWQFCGPWLRVNSLPCMYPDNCRRIL